MKNLRHLVRLLLLTIVFTHCASQSRDISVKKDLAAKAKAELSFVGVRVVVREGVVTLNGACATLNTRDEVLTKVGSLYGVRSVVNNIDIKEVIIGRDWLLKQSVDSVLTEYAQVEAITLDSTVTLQGKVEAAKLQPLLLAIRRLQPKSLKVELNK